MKDLKGSVTIYCEKCDKNHAFTPTEVERLVYVLTGDGYDRDMAPCKHDDPSRPQRRENEWYCLKEMIGWGRDSEMYYEFVEQCVELRKLHSLPKAVVKS